MSNPIGSEPTMRAFARRRQLLRSHPRLMGAIIVGTVVCVALPQTLDPVVRALTGWNFAVWAYLILMAWLVAHGDEARMHRLAKQEDTNAGFVLAVMSLGAILSLVAIVMQLASAKQVTGGERIFHYLFTGATVLGSWLLVGAIYTFHYAHMFYRAKPDEKPLRFPDNFATPSYWDFLYFSFTIAVAAQTSDVTIVTTSMRKAVLAQSILSFLFNVAILGLTINIAAGALGN